MLIPDNEEQIQLTINSVKGFLLSVKNLSVNINFSYDSNEILDKIDFLKQENKEVYINLNKNYTNDEVVVLEEFLVTLSKKDIDGIFFSDISLLKLAKNYNLIWAAEHATTNYKTANTFSDYGAKGIFISPDIPLEEMKEIREKTKLKTYIQIFGYHSIFTSVRKHITSYMDVTENKNEKKLLKMKLKEEEYPILENSLGTVIFNSKIINGFFINEQFDSFIVNGFNIENDKLKKVVEAQDSEVIKKLFENIDENIFSKKTIYRVKGDK